MMTSLMGTMRRLHTIDKINVYFQVRLLYLLSFIAFCEWGKIYVFIAVEISWVSLFLYYVEFVQLSCLLRN